MTMGGTTPLPRFVQPTVRDHHMAREIVDSHPVVSAYDSTEWDEMDADGRDWVAAIVREAQARVALDADTIVHANAFLTHMAERYRERLATRLLGFRVTTISREEAMGHALATFDASLDLIGATFGDPAYGWERDHAHELVDEELQHWEG